VRGAGVGEVVVDLAAHPVELHAHLGGQFMLSGILGALRFEHQHSQRRLQAVG